MYYTPPPGLKIPTVAPEPNARDLELARAKILEPFEDFKFATDADKAACVALYFQPFIRHLIAGHVPLFAFDAPVFGSGKTLAARAALMPVVMLFGSVRLRQRAGGNTQGADLQPARRPPGNHDRQRHRADSDNPVLAKVLTDDYHSDRLLGGNQAATLPVRAIFVMTGNNLSFARDLPRRAVSIPA